jgi:hypothetical protein
VSYAKAKAVKTAAAKARTAAVAAAPVKAFGKFAVTTPSLGLSRSVPVEIKFASMQAAAANGALGDLAKAAAAADMAALGASLIGSRAGSVQLASAVSGGAGSAGGIASGSAAATSTTDRSSLSGLTNSAGR